MAFCLFLLTTGVSQAANSSDSVDDAVEIYEVEDVSYGSVKRFTYRVVIHKPVTPKEIKHVGRNVIEVAKIKTPFNALSIFFYDYPEFAGGIYTLAKAEMAPGGEWAEADSVDTGDYDSMRVVWDIKEKDWNDQLTPREAKIYGRGHEIWLANPDWTDEKINEIVAEEFGLTAEEAGKITIKYFKWARQDLSE